MLIARFCLNAICCRLRKVTAERRQIVGHDRPFRRRAVGIGLRWKVDDPLGRGIINQLPLRFIKLLFELRQLSLKEVSPIRTRLDFAIQVGLNEILTPRVGNLCRQGGVGTGESHVNQSRQPGRRNIDVAKKNFSGLPLSNRPARSGIPLIDQIEGGIILGIAKHREEFRIVHEP